MDLVCISCLRYEQISLSSRLVGGMYGNFAGRDASRGMAKQSFDLGECRFSIGCPKMDSILNISSQIEMLTPVDQPIDKLEDLDQTEM